MSVLTPIDTTRAGDCPRTDVLEHGVVAVHSYGFGHSNAACSCGWSGKRRYLKAAAAQDAWLHAVHAKCAIAVPLVLPLRRA